MQIAEKLVVTKKQTVRTEYICRLDFGGMEVLYSTLDIDG
jgi:hypothetical protein